MGRNYIAERTIADPRERAAAKSRKQRAAARQRANEASGLAAYLERSKWCKAGCGQLAVGGVDGWWPCCSHACHESYLRSLDSKKRR